ncbi:diaminopimelate epimerase [Sphingomonas jinjuensis]|nr:diaminopimelate epimerase [Sphingomonas jinjuensis]
MRFGIVKCHGSGNDFPMIDAREIELSAVEWATVARALADRRGAVGGDGLLLLGKSLRSCDFSMAMFNSDGSEAETCLNGLRCVARMGFEALGIDQARVALKTSEALVERVPELAPGVYSVLETAGPASLDVAAWPMVGEAAPLVERAIPRLPGERRFTAVAMPNPHLVAFVEAVDEDELVRVGEVCEAAPDWLPNRANVSFVEVRGNALFVRTFERGVGLTDSCGSAMAASTYAACLTGRIGWDRETVVLNRGGMVRARAGEDAMVSIAGNATYEWTGSVTVDLGSGTAGDLVIEAWRNDEIAAWGAVADEAAWG